MKRFTVICGLLGALCGVSTAIAHDNASAQWNDEVQTTLLDALRAAYPYVDRWDARALIAQRESKKLAAYTLATAKVGRLGPRSELQIALRSQDGKTMALSAWYAVRGYAPAVTASRDIAALQPLSPADGYLVEQDVLALGCESLRVPEELDGMRSKRRVTGQQVFCASAIERRPAVTRGEVVTVRYSGRSVALTTTGVAQRDAGIGQQLPVKNPRTKELFVATVSAATEVAIREQ